MRIPIASSLQLTPIWREARLGGEVASLLWGSDFRRPQQAGYRRGVFLIPGFLTGDAHLAPLDGWLRRCGHRTGQAGMRLNVDCSAATMERLEQRLEQFAARMGCPVAIVGQSRGGLLARVLAVRRPDLVDSVVTLGSPHRRPLAVHPLLLAQGAGLVALGSLGVPRMPKRSCHSGSCCEQFREDLAGPFPTDVSFVSVYSRSDGLVDWRACLDPAATQVEVDSTHCGMAVNARAYGAIAEALDRSPRVPRRRRAQDIRLAA
jgi:triacylglycerol lipase